jgi:uncharacterized MnhB-related membrane protein
MGTIVIVVGCLLCAYQAIRSPRLIMSALWLAGASALVALLLYLLGAPEIAVIELSVGAGLVTVLFVFAINIAGDEPFVARNLVPRSTALALVILAVGLLGYLVLPAVPVQEIVADQPGFAYVVWLERGVDSMLQVLLILAGVLGVLGLLAEGKKSPPEEMKS